MHKLIYLLSALAFIFCLNSCGETPAANGGDDHAHHDHDGHDHADHADHAGHDHSDHAENTAAPATLDAASAKSMLCYATEGESGWKTEANNAYYAFDAAGLITYSDAGTSEPMDGSWTFNEDGTLTLSTVMGPVSATIDAGAGTFTIDGNVYQRAY